ncbi:MAG: hypothetical protein GTO67_11080 [Gammaproteobacteria bacterium]|nr:hypothetical protein [Gammaproteobacteria bacterium]NIN39153.1 hypothetical protein [Gammaproteobacteria bacterium]NIO23986.1 hypothetical protein [Gammaproteobacteria bacterium]NIO64638.1 hypothetical protein [Gammaproteobacteria bacterium]NIP47298.1 hypothetical protein [Gammaproteobacteria bacterium]
MMIRNALILAILAMLAGGAVQADVQQGVNALGRGNYEKAREIFEPLAMTGDWNAQGFLAHTYRMMENNVEAYAWYHAMAKCGSVDARIELGILEPKLSGETIAEGKALGDIYHQRYCR